MKKTLSIIVLISILSIPTISQSAKLLMNPATLELPDKPIKAGEVYEKEGLPPFIVYSKEATTLKVSAQCSKSLKGICEPSHFSFFPNLFTLEPNQGQRIEWSLSIPLDYQKFGQHQAIVSASFSTIPSEQEEETEVGATASLGIGLGTLVNYKVAGKLKLWEYALLWVRRNIYNKLLQASIGLLNQNSNLNLLLFLFSFLGVLFVLDRIVGWFKRTKKRTL